MTGVRKMGEKRLQNLKTETEVMGGRPRPQRDVMDGKPVILKG